MLTLGQQTGPVCDTPLILMSTSQYSRGPGLVHKVPVLTYPPDFLWLCGSLQLLDFFTQLPGLPVFMTLGFNKLFELPAQVDVGILNCVLTLTQIILSMYFGTSFPITKSPSSLGYGFQPFPTTQIRIGKVRKLTGLQKSVKLTFFFFACLSPFILLCQL